MEHKAFLFDHASFERELRPSLEDALGTGDTSRLVSFIEANRHARRDPYEGEPLGADWIAHIEVGDAHQYGDVALTKYYRPTDDIGLGLAWERVQDLVTAARCATSPILGTTVGPRANPFDPGKMGSYFQSASMVRDSYAFIVRLASSPDVTGALEMLETASSSNSGLYITF